MNVFKPIIDLTAEDCDRMMAVNVRGVFLMTQAAARVWLREGRPGVAVNLASNLALVGAPLASLYCASKAAVVAFTKAAAAELGPSGIRVNALCPGPVETEFNREFRAAGAQREWELATPLRNPGRKPLPDADAIAPAAVFLASDGARHITGSTLLVDGGANAV